MDRYIDRPAQALGNTIGKIRIRERRSLAKKLISSKFDPRSFNNTVLTDGAMPLDWLEARIAPCIATRK